MLGKLLDACAEIALRRNCESFNAKEKALSNLAG
jgi:hypothetical protein